MHRSERERLVGCLDCGAEIRIDPDRGFAFGARGALCWDCAIRRGGRYDETHDHWTQDPRIDDLGPQNE